MIKQKKSQNTVMRTGHYRLSDIILGSALAIVLTFASGCAPNGAASDQMKPMKGGEHQQMLNK